jgi:hypothetical protein
MIWTDMVAFWSYLLPPIMQPITAFMLLFALALAVRDR